jgi:hypothetical protein
LFLIQNERKLKKVLLLIDAHRVGGGGERGEGWGAPHEPAIKIFEKLPNKNAIRHDPPDFLTTPSTPLKRICQKKPSTPPWISNYYAFACYV